MHARLGSKFFQFHAFFGGKNCQMIAFYIQLWNNPNPSRENPGSATEDPSWTKTPLDRDPLPPGQRPPSPWTETPLWTESQIGVKTLPHRGPWFVKHDQCSQSCASVVLFTEGTDCPKLLLCTGPWLAPDMFKLFTNQTRIVGKRVVGI